MAMGFGPCMAKAICHLGRGGTYYLCFNTMIIGSFQVKRSIKQGCPLAPLLFAIYSHPLMVALKDSASKGEIQGLVLPDGHQRLVDKMFVDDSLLFLKAEQDILRKALQIVQLIVVASGSKCNIEKSNLISLAEDDSFHDDSWAGVTVPRGQIFRHLGDSLGVGTTFKQAFQWYLSKFKQKMQRWEFTLLPFHYRPRVINSFMISYFMFIYPLLKLSKSN